MNKNALGVWWIKEATILYGELGTTREFVEMNIFTKSNWVILMLDILSLLTFVMYTIKFHFLGIILSLMFFLLLNGIISFQRKEIYKLVVQRFDLK